MGPYREPRLSMLRSCCSSSAFGILIGLLVQTSYASTLTTAQFVTEFLQESQGEDAALVFLQFGADSSSPLGFTSTVDVSALSFSYALVPGSTYAGQSITLSGTGIYDPTLNTWALASSGMLGTVPWTTTGTDVITSLDFAFSSDRDLKDKDGNKIGDVHDDCVVDEKTLLSDCTFQFTDKDGKKVGKPFPVKDKLVEVPGTWSWNADGSAAGFVISSIGNSPFTGGSGSFTTVISAVPGPASIFLVGAGLFVIGTGFLLRRRQRRALHRT